MNFTGERFIPGIEDVDNEIQIEHLQRYQSVTELVKNKTVLDAACGEGYGSDILSKSAYHVYGLDIDEQSIKHAKETYGKLNIDFLVGSIEKLPFEDAFFDVIVSFETIEHVNEDLQNKFLNEIKRVLKKDGLLIISTPNKEVYSEYRNYSNPFHVKEFYKDEFYDFLKSRFKNVDFYYQLRESTFLLSNEKNQFFTNLETKKEYSRTAKYIVAICSEEISPKLDISSVIVEDAVFNKKIERIIQLQNEVEERNKHITSLNETMEKNNKHIVSLQQTVKEKENINTQLTSESKQIQNQYNKLSEDIMRIKEIEKELRQRINNFESENEILKEKERFLNNILVSDGWRLLLKYYKVRDAIIPTEGKFGLFLKMFKKVIIDRNFKMINKENIKKFSYYYKNQELSMLENRVDNYIERQTNGSQEFQLSIEEQTQNFERIIFEKFDKPKVSIIIPVYNQWNYTYACMKSISLQTKNIPYEVIIADDMSNDETVNIAEYVENVKIIRDGENRGFLLNCNNAAKYADGDYIFFLNNDTQVQEGWLDSLIQLIESDQHIGMVGSKLVYPDGRLQEAGGIIWDDASGWNYGRLDDPTKPEYNYVKEVDYISGAAIMIRKSLWQTIGGFDERYVPAYFEDSDLAFEVRKHGFKVMLQPKSVVVHFEGISHGVNVSEGVKRYQELNKTKFIEKWSNVLSREHYKNGECVFKARDKSKYRKTIVVIDHYVPHFDKDAGSRTTYHYLKLFTEMGLNVKFIGDNYYKHEPYTTEIEKLGVEVLYQPYNYKTIDQWFKQNGKEIDYVYMNRPHISVKYIDIIKKYTNSKIIYYGHDLHFLREYREYKLTGNESLKKSAEEWKKTEFDLYDKSDVIYYPSDVEVQEIKKHYPNINAKAIPAYIFDEQELSNQKVFDDTADILFVGGFGHKPNIDAVLWFVSYVFPLILDKKPSMKFYIVGSNPPDEIKSLSSNNIIVTGFVTDEELIKLYNQCRIVVVPLRYGAGVKGKVVEAMYYQLPIVTTPIGAEGIIGSENILLIAETELDFATKVLDLYDDIESLKVLSKASINYINENFTSKAVQKIISPDISN